MRPTSGAQQALCVGAVADSCAAQESKDEWAERVESEVGRKQGCYSFFLILFCFLFEFQINPSLKFKPLI
jgi:hypothetical protein